jgi:hypothetical protein
MDHHTFDALVSRLAAAPNRRLLIQSVSFGVLAAVAGPTLTDAKRKRKKKKVRFALLGEPCTGEGDGNCSADALAASAVCSAVAGQPGFGSCCVPSGWSPTAPATLCAAAPGNAPAVANPACCSGFCSAVEGQFECA